MKSAWRHPAAGQTRRLVSPSRQPAPLVALLRHASTCFTQISSRKRANEEKINRRDRSPSPIRQDLSASRSAPSSRPRASSRAAQGYGGQAESYPEEKAKCAQKQRRTHDTKEPSKPCRRRAGFTRRRAARGGQILKFNHQHIVFMPCFLTNVYIWHIHIRYGD